MRGVATARAVSTVSSTNGNSSLSSSAQLTTEREHQSATFQRQAERDPEQRWDWSLFVDEVQMFVKAERAEDAERMWTRTRSMGVGLISAHQGLNQLGEKLCGIVLNVIGGMCLGSGVRDDARSFVDAYANQGLQVEDFTGIKAREELMIRGDGDVAFGRVVETLGGDSPRLPRGAYAQIWSVAEGAAGMADAGLH